MTGSSSGPAIAEQHPESAGPIPESTAQKRMIRSFFTKKVHPSPEQIREFREILPESGCVKKNLFTNHLIRAIVSFSSQRNKK